jgi:hypothetical protein
MTKRLKVISTAVWCYDSAAMEYETATIVIAVIMILGMVASIGLAAVRG